MTTMTTTTTSINPPTPTLDPLATERRRALRFGWTSLAAWATGGVALELAHALKLASYLDDETTRLLLTLAHAHGVGLALVVLAYAVAGAPLFARDPARAAPVGRLMRAAALLLPLGFALGAIGHPEGDPGVGVLLVPVGALALVVALVALAVRAWRTRNS